jgi:hypothetical protein
MSRRALLLVSGLLTLTLIGTTGLALHREIAPARPDVPAVATTPRELPAPLTEAEEAYAEALWPLHQEIVEPSAGRLTFAGLAYAVDDHDSERLAAKLGPLRDTFRNAHEKVAAVPAPASMQSVRERYLESLSLYERSAAEMMEVAQDGNDRHLVLAQQTSERAAEDLVKAGDILWPGEHKPN